MKTIMNTILTLFLSSVCFAQYYENTLFNYSESASDQNKTLFMMGEHYLKSDKVDSAMQYFNQLRMTLSQLDQENNEIYIPICIQLANYYFQTGQFGESENYYQKARYIISSKFGNVHMEYATILGLLANLYKRTGRFELSNKNYSESLQLLKSIGFENTSLYSVTLTNHALLHIMLGNKAEAEKLFILAKTQMECNEKTSDLNYVYILENLGKLYFNQLKLDEAETLYFKALQIRKILQHEQNMEYAECLNSLGLIHQQRRNYELAETYYLQVIQIVSKDTNNIVYPHFYNNLAMFYFKTNQFAKAESLFLEVKHLYENHFGKSSRTYLSLLENLAELYYKMNNPAEASKYFIEASKLRKRIIYDSFKYLTSNESEEFLKGLQNGVANFNTYLLQSKNSSEVLLKEAFENELFYKGFLMNFHLESNNLIQANPDLKYLSDKIKEVYKLIATEYSKTPLPILKIDSLEELAHQFEKQMGQKFAKYNDIVRIVDLNDIARILKPKEAVVEIMYLKCNTDAENNSIAYAAMIIPYGSTTPILVNLCKEDEIQNLFLKSNSLSAEYVNALYNTNSRGLKPIERTKNNLYELIWKKIEIHLSGIKTIYYTPAGLLQKINIQAIPIPKYGVIGEYYDIIQLTSSKQLLQLSKKVKTYRSALVMGGIQYDEVQNTTNYDHNLEAKSRGNSTSSIEVDNQNYWSELDHTFREIYHVAELFHKSKIQVNKYSGVEASEENFMKIANSSISPDIIHIATHGYFFPELTQNLDSTLKNKNCPFINSTNPMMRSGLILAYGNYGWNHCQPIPGRKEDGILTAMEISQMNLHETQLAVLSACETGLGEIKGNEGVYGLQRAFKIAGVKNLIVALWQVPDFQTEELMLLFYSNLLQHHMDIHKAFRKAQQEMKNKYNDPYFWAGFVLVQ